MNFDVLRIKLGESPVKAGIRVISLSVESLILGFYGMEMISIE